MKPIDLSGMSIVKAGVQHTMPTPLTMPALVQKLERNESCVFWVQPQNGKTEDQVPCVNVNGIFYALNSKLEKAVFRNVRLTRDFHNYELLPDGTPKLRIPQRLLMEKYRTSTRVLPLCIRICLSPSESL